MDKSRWPDWAYYAAIYVVGLVCAVASIYAMGRWGAPSGWGLLTLWVVAVTSALALKLRSDRRKRHQANVHQAV